MRRANITVRSWPLMLRPHHLRALAILVTLVSLSLLFSTFTMRSGDNRMWIMDPGRHHNLQDTDGRPVMSTVDAHHQPAYSDTNHSQTEGTSITLTPTTKRRRPTKIHGVGEVYQITRKSINPSNHLPVAVAKNKIKFQGYLLPAAPSALLKTRNLFQNRTVTQEDINNTLTLLNKRLEENKQELDAEVEAQQHVGYWNVTHPKRLLIVTSWRSGSTFLGQILSEHPGVYNHYEPLMHVGLEQIRPGDPRVDSAIQHLKDLLHCKYSNQDFLKKIQESMQDMLSHNAHVWQACVLGPNRNVCSLSNFLEEACHKFPALTMKMVRLRLNLTRQLLDDPSVKVLYLVRDPRATMNSRLSSVKWCSQSIDCIDPGRLCDDIQSDLDAFESLSAEFPGRVALIKYETMAKSPHATFRSIFNFAGLFYTRKIREEVEKHTSRDENHPWSTVRKSAERVDLWRQKLDTKSISNIQSVCSNVLAKLGYSQL